MVIAIRADPALLNTILVSVVVAVEAAEEEAWAVDNAEDMVDINKTTIITTVEVDMVVNV